MKRGAKIENSASKKQKKNNITLRRCLDDMAWLLEQNSSSCTAVCIINNKLIIADNDLSESSTEKAAIKYCEKVLSYLIAEPKTEKTQVLLKEFMLSKARAIYKGSITAGIKLETIEKIIDCCLDDDVITAEKIFSKLNLKHYKENVGALCQLFLKFKRRTERVRCYLRENPESALHLALTLQVPSANSYLRYSSEQALNLADRDWLLDGKTFGYKILLTNQKGTHAELKIIDFVLVAQLLDEAKICVVSPLGISKKCCKSCHNLIELVNEIINKHYDLQENFFKTTDKHRLSFTKWNDNLPIFLHDFDEVFLLTASVITELYKKNRSLGFILNEKLHTYKNLEKEKDFKQAVPPDCSMWLNRRFSLCDDIRTEFNKTLHDTKSSREAPSPMSQSSPDFESLKKPSNDILQKQQLDFIATETLITELKLRAARQKNQLAATLLKQLDTVFSVQQPGADSAISKQVVGLFEGEQVVFNVFKTLGDGNCGFYSLPLPHDKQKIITLMLANKQDEILRHAVYVEIIEALKADYLSKNLMQHFKQFDVYKQTEATFDYEERNFISKIRAVVPQVDNKPIEGNLNEITEYLKTVPNPTAAHSEALLMLNSFLTKKSRWNEEFKAFCKSDSIFDAFIESYRDDTTRLAFALAGQSFDREHSLLDIVLKLLSPPVQIYIWGQKQPDSTEVEILYQGGDANGAVTHIYHTSGLDTHFELMAQSGKSNWYNQENLPKKTGQGSYSYSSRVLFNSPTKKSTASNRSAETSPANDTNFTT